MKKKAFDWSSIPNLVVRGAGKWLHARVEMNGKEHWRALHIQADPEGKNADVVKDALRAYKLGLAQDHFAILQLTRSRNETAKLSEIEAAYRAACAGRDISIDTVDRNLDWLKHIVRSVEGEFVDVANVRASIFTADFLAAFQEKRIAKLKAKAAAEHWPAEDLEQKMKTAKNTIKSAINQARSVFAAELLESRHYRDLELPDLTKFLAFRAEGSSVAAYQRPAADVWQKILAGLPALKERSLAQWFAFQLGVNCGLRRGSARAARWGWCKELEGGEAEMEVRRAKGGHYYVRLSAPLWADLKTARSSTDYIIPCAYEDAKERDRAAAEGKPVNAGELTRDEAVDGVVAWLRELGFDARLPFHTLRKMYGAKVAAEHGLSEAQNALGHKKADLTHAVYADHRQVKSVTAV